MSIRSLPSSRPNPTTPPSEATPSRPPQAAPAPSASSPKAVAQDAFQFLAPAASRSTATQKAVARDVFQSFAPTASSSTAPQKAAGAAGVLAPDFHRSTVGVRDIQGLEKAAGQPLTVSQLAAAYPNARIEGRGATLAQIASHGTGKVGADGMPITLGAATIDKNGDLDVSNLYRQELGRYNQNLLLKKGDEYPVPLSHTIRNSEFVVREDAHRSALQAAGFGASGKSGEVRVDMKDMEQVRKALAAVGVSPSDPARIAQELKAQGVSVPLSNDDQLRRVLVGKLDSSKNELDIDDRLVKNTGDHNQEIRPTIYASAKISPEHLNETILAYKHYNNQSYAGQGSWTTELLGKDKASQHEFDAEATFLKMNTNTHELEGGLAARHYYGELYSKKDLDDLKAKTGRDDLTVSISYKAHGSRFAELNEKNTAAGHGADGVKSYDPRDHVFKDQFMGLKDVQSGKAELIPKDKVDLVIESDDRQSLNLQTHFGATRKGILGTGVMDIFNDGMAPDRFGGSQWFYQQEKLQTEGNSIDRAGRKIASAAGEVKDRVVDGFHSAKAAVGRFLGKLAFW